MNDLSPGKTRRLIFILSGATDSLIGAGLLLLGFKILPVDVSSVGLPDWVYILLGAVMFIAGVSVAVYNFSRLEE